MMDWLANNLALIMFVSMFFFIFVGYPVAFIMGGLSLVPKPLNLCAVHNGLPLPAFHQLMHKYEKAAAVYYVQMLLPVLFATVPMQPFHPLLLKIQEKKQASPLCILPGLPENLCFY